MMMHMNNLFYELNFNDKITPKITYTNKTYFNKNKINEFKLNVKLYREKIKSLKENSYFHKITKLNYLINDTNYLFKLFNIDFTSNKCGFIRADYIDNKLKYYVRKASYNSSTINKANCILPNCNVKFNTIIQNMISLNMYEKLKNLNNCNIFDTLLDEYYYQVFYYLFDILELNGNLFFTFYTTITCDNNEIDIIYLLSFMFEKITIYNGIFLYCSGFKAKNSLITQDDILNIIKNKKFNIEPKNNLNNLVNYFDNFIDITIKLNNLFINNKYDEYLDIWFLQIFETLTKNNIILINDELKTDILKKLYTFFKRTYLDKSITKINSCIKNSEGSYIYDVINKNKYYKCLEVGMAFGISAFYILSNTNTTLISIDPYQKTQWKCYGEKLIKESKFNKRHTLITKKSYEALPELLKKHGEESFELIFIDGWHTFDYTLVDFFYSNLLLKIGGMIIIDDALHPGVESCVSYLSKNYLFYEKLNSPYTVASYKKLKNDDRPWNYHVKI